MIVCKFGGSSVADKEMAKKIKEICKNKNRKIIVVSALGQSELYAYKVTDKLYEVYNCLISKEDYKQKLEDVFSRYKQLACELCIDIDWSKEKEDLESKINKNNASKEYLVSRGEYYSAMIYAKYLNGKFIDAKNYIIFTKAGKVDIKKTAKKLQDLKKYQKCIIGGFYGATSKGEICLFDRGGSDITGAIISRCLNAEIYENYTDVDGVYNKNPNIFSSANKISLLDFKTAIHMAECGNEVVHKIALEQIKNSEAILNVKSTNEYNKLGTIVVESRINSDDLMICKSNCYLAVFDHLKQNDIIKMSNYIDLYKAVKIHDKYFIYFKSIYITIETFKKLFNCLEVDNYIIFTFFKNGIFNKKNVKNIKKINKKTKKNRNYGIFLSYLNNFQLICGKSKEKILLKTINKYFQN